MKRKFDLKDKKSFTQRFKESPKNNLKTRKYQQKNQPLKMLTPRSFIIARIGTAPGVLSNTTHHRFFSIPSFCRCQNLGTSRFDRPQPNRQGSDTLCILSMNTCVRRCHRRFQVDYNLHLRHTSLLHQLLQMFRERGIDWLRNLRQVLLSRIRHCLERRAYVCFQCDRMREVHRDELKNKIWMFINVSREIFSNTEAWP